jgi:hypothetical protein
VLLAVGALLTAGTVKQVHAGVAFKSRIPQVQRAYGAWVRSRPPAYGRPFARQGDRSDVACGFKYRIRPVRRTRYRQCLLIGISGRQNGRVIGGYRLPRRGTDERHRRFACFGVARRSRTCLPERRVPLSAL